jgi:predicted  nucleic acid-binding Zn-ribbon protein
MTDKTYQAIVDALDILATGAARKTNGKISATNLAKEAGISKATLYRYFGAHAKLQQDFFIIKKNGGSTADVAETVQDENAQLKSEIKILRSKVSEQEKMYSLLNTQKAHQTLVLWKEVERLKNECERLLKKLESHENVTVFPGKPLP